MYNTVVIIFVLLMNDSNLLKRNVIMQVIELVLSMVLRLFECHYLLNKSAGWGRDKPRKVLGDTLIVFTGPTAPFQLSSGHCYLSWLCSLAGPGEWSFLGGCPGPGQGLAQGSGNQGFRKHFSFGSSCFLNQMVWLRWFYSTPLREKQMCSSNTWYFNVSETIRSFLEGKG